VNESQLSQLMMPPPILKMELLFVESRRTPEEGETRKIRSTVEGEATVQSIVGVTTKKAIGIGIDETWNGAVARAYAACVIELLGTFGQQAFEDALRSKAASACDLSPEPDGREAGRYPVAPEYETDLAAWAVAQAQALRSGRYADVDASNVAEELIGVGRQEGDAIEHWLTVAMTHLLMADFHAGFPEQIHKPTREVERARDHIQDILKESPSLRDAGDELVESAYKSATLHASMLANCSEFDFPQRTPYTFTELMERTLPE
jgi:Domain of unknown function DUF29